MRGLVLALVLASPSMVLAEDWQALTGAEISTALTARVLGYDGGEMQNFFADGRTLYEVKGGESWGKWKVEGDQFCSVWPPSDHWACYDLQRDGTGRSLRFVGSDGAVSVGRYADE
jgi:hypothetical protein